jgi:Alw26I/Eco31I/Esp3I family type II restriction endonuclease
MTTLPNEDNKSIIDSAAAYGSKGQKWNLDFVLYMKAIVSHPNYSGMPDAIKEDGKIQWEAPSNRKSGLYKDTHQKRRDWWNRKAKAIGIEVGSPNWISATAKKIHPFGQKPCKRCGRVMRIAYSYPNGLLAKRLKRIFGDNFVFDPLEQLSELVIRLNETYGVDGLSNLPTLLKTANSKIPNHGNNIEAWLKWIENEFIPLEPSILSPGAMANPPDRLDGFHSFNLCCRTKADTGRHDANMRIYNTDRRVFEYWTEGDWIAADRLMGIVSSQFREEKCADGGTGPCSLDHIGPLSLGFCHRPAFRLLSKAANSAKNNRMTTWDIKYLINEEKLGRKVISWYAEKLWDSLKTKVHDEETALRISKVLRDNQRIAMRLLGKIYELGYLSFLSTFLELEFANNNIDFENLRIENFITVFDTINRTPRVTKYTLEQKARRIRIGFAALGEYLSKKNRHNFNITDEYFASSISNVIKILEDSPNEIKLLDAELSKILSFRGADFNEEGLRTWVDKSLNKQIEGFLMARKLLIDIMNGTASKLSSQWDDERYVRKEFDFDTN